MDTNAIVMKCVVIGDSGAGKSALTFRFVDNIFFPDGVSTLGVDFKFTTVDVPHPGVANGGSSSRSSGGGGGGKVDGGSAHEQQCELCHVKLHIWDACGQSSFATLVSSFYRGSNAVIMCFDLTNRESFENLNDWLERVRANTEAPPLLLLVGCKYDLVEGDASPSRDKSSSSTSNSDRKGGGGGLQFARQVSSAEACAWAARAGAICYFETSAKNDSNVRDAFSHLAAQFVSDLAAAGRLDAHRDQQPRARRSVSLAQPGRAEPAGTRQRGDGKPSSDGCGC